MPPIRDTVRQALIDRGWKIDETAVENRAGELHEFIHPETGTRRAWLDAFFDQETIEYNREQEAEKK
jgi:hypothetical protein